MKIAPVAPGFDRMNCSQPRQEVPCPVQTGVVKGAEFSCSE